MTGPAGGPYPPYPHYPPSPTVVVHPRPRRWPWIIGIVLALLVGISIGGASERAERRAEDRAAAASSTAPRPAAPPTTEVAAVAATVEPAAPTGPRTTVGDGIWEVGVDVAPGKYKTAGPQTDRVIENCYYARLSEPDGFEGVISNNNTKGPSTVELTGDVRYFESSGCQDWVLQQ